jgi:hypothetical protein
MQKTTCRPIIGPSKRSEPDRYGNAVGSLQLSEKMKEAIKKEKPALSDLRIW